MKQMKASLPHPEHESYLKHRRQNVTQVLLPVILALMFAAFVFTAILAGLVYLMSRLHKILPHYTGQAQDLVYRIEGIVRRALDTSVKPVFGLQEVGAFLR